MKKLILIGVACVPLLLAQPSDVAAQSPTCRGYCDGCYDPYGGTGHIFIINYALMTGLMWHGCGGVDSCGFAGHTYECDPPEVSLWPEGIDSVLELSGKELYALLGELDGRVVYNSSRRSIQVRDCQDRSLIVASITLRDQQVAEMLQAQAAAEIQAGE